MSSHAASFPLRYSGLGRSFTDLALSGAMILLTIGLVGTAVFLLTGGKALIVRSGSMEPAIRTGDLVVTKTVHPTEVNEGDVITFSDPTRSGVLVTHRAQTIAEQGGRLAFVTKGDSNGGVEEWSIDKNGTVGRLMFTFPKVGYAVSWAAEPGARFGLLVAGGLLLTYSALRKIWAR
jgi:signal peptidase I